MEFYTETEIRDMLRLGEKQCKALMQTDGFPSIKVGREYRILKSAFTEWLQNTKEIKLNYAHL